MKPPKYLDQLLAPFNAASTSLWGDSKDVVLSANLLRIMRWSLYVAIFGATSQGIIHFVNVVLLDAKFALLNADVDIGVFTWASSLATGIAAFGVVLVAAQLFRFRKLMLGVGGILAFFSLDDAVGIHERISIDKIGPIAHASRIAWIAFSLPLLAAAFLGLLAFGLRAPDVLRKTLIWGLSALVLAISLEGTSPILFALGSDHGNWLYELEVVFEEGLELAGWILIGAATSVGALLLGLLNAQRAQVIPDR